MKKILSSLVVIVATTGSLYAQTGADALRFSQTNYGSTARFKSMGGAQIGVGGDMSSLGGNPAGLGLFTKSEFSFTPEFNMMKGKADFLGERTNSSKNMLNLNNVGAVFYNPTYKPKGQDPTKGVISTVFGVGYSRNNDFTGKYSFNGTNNQNSVNNFFAEEANFFAPGDPTTLTNYSIEKMAYDNYLINYDGTNDVYSPATRAPYRQSQNEIRTGATSEMNVAGALNISNKFYVGASLNFVNSRYVSDRSFKESGYNTGVLSNYDLDYRTNSEIKGAGFNARLGIIYRPDANLRIGATYQSPSWMYYDDVQAHSLSTSYSEGIKEGLFTNTPGVNGITYQLRTPGKGSLGASYVLGGRALISADIDYVDYSSIHYSVDQDNNQGQVNNANDFISDNYQSAVNYRIGAEYKVDNAVSLRAGYGNNGTAIKNDTKSYFGTEYYTGGVGYRVGNYYLDLAYQRIQGNVDLDGYFLNNGSEPVANIKTSRDNVFLTFGVRF
ncbi:outer membrane protein transport protein [Pedobacter sp. PLR]|uniref:OmpP1/FadL family transporter n=1 Tax=Pedobacter sp. PLR TaxID=2994465 RepID=UPI002246FBC6|nr:outer membrane protein transport protein [Pedobacter sp. PLR]MCX2451667.1 outer membrane protein transport protein [Pedobacter sp. PLR]